MTFEEYIATSTGRSPSAGGGHARQRATRINQREFEGAQALLEAEEAVRPAADGPLQFG